MAKKSIKPRKLKFFATFVYGLFFWVLMLLTSVFFIFVTTSNRTEDWAGYTIVAILLCATISMGIIRKVRRRSLSLKLSVEPICIPYTADEIKHYVGLQENDIFTEEYNAMCAAYNVMRKSKMVQIITSSKENTELRSATKNWISLAETRLEMSACPVLYLKKEVPTFLESDGATFYLYPHFVLRVGGKKDITAFSYAEFDIDLTEGSYILGEEAKVPRDAMVVGKAYKYSNKDGSPDMRVKDNPSTLMIRIADIESENYGIYYQLSNYEAAENFFSKFNEFVAKTIATEVCRSNSIETLLGNDEGITAIADNGGEKLSQEKSFHVNKQTFSPENPYEELNSLIGLDNVKNEIKSLANLVKVQQAREKNDLKNVTMSYHLVFTGNPGTGKTTIGRIIAAIYRDLGILKKGHLVETDRSGLVAGYLGQTATKTNAIIDEALDGVLFIDEAYSLSEEHDSYGKEAIATLLKRMEDERDRLVVVLAGYTDPMKQFITSNPGLESRFNRYIDFPDYSEDELMQIFMKQIEKYDYEIEDEALAIIKESIHNNVINKDEQFGNARYIRNMFEKILANQANRLAREIKIDSEKLKHVTTEDCHV